MPGTEPAPIRRTDESRPLWPSTTDTRRRQHLVRCEAVGKTAGLIIYLSQAQLDKKTGSLTSNQKCLVRISATVYLLDGDNVDIAGPKHITSEWSDPDRLARHRRQAPLCMAKYGQDDYDSTRILQI